MRPITPYLIAAALALVAGCDAFDVSELEREVVVEAYLVAGERLSEVRLTRTVPIDQSYDADSLGVTDADVRIELLTADGRVEEVYPYRAAARQSGLYVLDRERVAIRPEDGEDLPIVQPLRTYRLVVTSALSGGPITSTTTVPDTFRVLSVSRDTVVYRSDAPWTAILSRPVYPRRQNVFLLTTVALEPSVEGLMPFAKAVYENGDASIFELSERVSPLLNEENFDRVGDGALRVQYPWLGLNFYGRNRVVIQALDDNLYDFVRSQSVQQGGSTLPPGEIPNVLEHVDGGRGIFGSVARAHAEFVVLRGADAGE